MNLRWILLIAGLVLIAAIYFWDRRNRRTQPSDRLTSARLAGDRLASDRQSAHLTLASDQEDGGRQLADAYVPELDESSVVRHRVADRPPTITASDIGYDAEYDADDLPPMHTGTSLDSSVSLGDASLSPTVAGESSRDSPMSGVSTGSFIAMQAQRPELLQARGKPDVIGSIPTAPEASVTQEAPIASSRPMPRKPPASRKIVALRLSAGSDRVEGSRLKALLESAGLRHGKYSIYHRLHAADVPLFSVASMVEPGTFDPFAMTGVQFPGVTIFTQLPGPLAGSEMFTQMLGCARELEQGIGGLLQDERGLPLTEQREQRLRDEIADFLHLLGQT